MAYGPSPEQYDMTPGHQWWTDNAPPGVPTGPDWNAIDPNARRMFTETGAPSGAPGQTPPPPAQGSQPPPQYGGPFAQIAQWFKQYTGRDPSDAEVRQWGTNLDANYLAKIENSIKTLGANSGYWDLSTNAPKATGPTSTPGNKPAFDENAFWTELESQPANGENAKKIAEKYGVKVLNSKGDKLEFPDGRQFDVGVAFGTGDPNQMKWARNQIGGPGYNGQPSNLLSPFPEQFQSKPLKTPDPFKAPSSDEAFNDQGFQFTLKQGKDALQKSAAANGTLLTTGTLQDLDSFSQGLASEQYDKVYNRKLGEYENNYGHIQTNYDRDRSNALQEYGLRHDLYNEAQDRPFTKLYQLSSLGTGGPGGSSYANGMSNTLTGIGNAQAASGLYGANAWQNGFGNLANLGGYYVGQYANRNSYSPYGPYASGYRF